MFKRFRRPGVYFNSPDTNTPFRGERLPLLKSSELESAIETVYDTYYFTFDTSRPDHVHPKSNRTYQAVLEAAFGGWFSVLHREHRWIDVDGVPVMHVYIEWAEPYRELTPEIERKFKDRLDTPVE